MRVKVNRYNPELDEKAYYEVFDIPCSQEDRMTVMDVLDYIALNCDSSISYYKHSACNHGICGRCGIKINGKPALACTYRVEEEEITLDPINQKRVKDLIVMERK